MAFKQYTQCINCLLCYAACPQYALNEEIAMRLSVKEVDGAP